MIVVTNQTLAGAAIVLCLVSLAVAASLPGQAQVEERHQKCAAPSFPIRGPNYSIERKEHTATKTAGLVLQISIPVEGSLSEASMIGLACKLKSDFAKEASVQALIFDDKRAARNLALGLTDQTDYGVYLWHLRGRFELRHEDKLGFIEFLLPRVQDELLSLERVKIWISSSD
jgi:hypothetical protein